MFCWLARQLSTSTFIIVYAAVGWFIEATSDMPARKWCFIPKCTNTSVKTPSKIFVTVPVAPKRRENWFAAARRNVTEVSPTSAVYCCEDHFDLEKDMENYMEYKWSNVKARMKRDIVPHKFVCEPDGNLLGKTRQRILEQVQEDATESCPSFTVPETCEKGCQTGPIRFSSKYVQTVPKLEKRNAAISPIKFQTAKEQSSKPTRTRLRLKSEHSDFSSA
ncbi:uncharacterized protein LOC108909508 [Anoplophora glabripennis]|uniref:uncharacterized protein LOC108909508 n=1 Tax=Anoplophora glabripennis TaxID=217634 RepID=UPI00087352EF|nr:uncharacterized protein LOC108909508 [Anoplophora glabripennis]